ncbi:MAG TPA: response regulator transcription factor [Patescibacteria group bacterium]|nr:response regulator transcription factor [Patescibacteria group bacterium]
MKLLIVEDEHKIANSIKKGLEQELFAVDVAYDGETGFDLASSEDYDAIILDRLLPIMDGVTICQKLREKQIHTPILLLTAKGQIEDKVEGFNAGADDYLTKPFAFEELLVRIRALLRRPKESIQSIMRVEDLELDTTSHTVKRDKQVIDLSAKEFSLLEYLVRHKGAVITKDQMIQHVWNYEANILPNTVEAFIKLLRNKIDYPFSRKKQLIHTIRGVGYKLGE